MKECNRCGRFLREGEKECQGFECSRARNEKRTADALERIAIVLEERRDTLETYGTIERAVKSLELIAASLEDIGKKGVLAYDAGKH